MLFALTLRPLRCGAMSRLDSISVGKKRWLQLFLRRLAFNDSKTRGPVTWRVCGNIALTPRSLSRLHPKGRWASLALQTKGQYFFVARDVAALEGLVEAGRGAEVPPQVLQSFVAAHAICAAKELALRGRVAELEALIKKARATGLEAAVIELLEAQIKKAALPLGAELPTFAVKDLKGAPLDLAALRGKVVLVDFWATWCGPCMVELPSLVKLHKELKGAGFAVVGVSLDDDLTQLREVLRVQGVEWPQYCDAKGWKNSLARKYRIDSIPATFLLGRDGRIVAKDLRGEALARAVRKALAGE